MTWGTLQIAVEGLFECLPQAENYYGATFEIWDYQDKFQWGFGKITTEPIDPPVIQTLAFITIGNDTSSANATENTASQGVAAA